MSETEQLNIEVQKLKNSVEDLSRDVRSLLDLWQRAKGVVTFVKWAAGLGTALGGFILFLKPYLK